MTDTAVETPPVDEGALAGFVTDVVGDLATLLTDPDSVRAWLGPTDDDTALEQFLAAHAADVADISSLVGELASGDLSPGALLEGSAGAWHSMQELVAAGPSLRVGAGEAAVNVLERLLGVVLDRQLRRRLPVVWAAARLLGLTGDGALLHQSAAALIDDPRAHIWRTMHERPGWAHLGLHWPGRGGRATSLLSGRFDDAIDDGRAHAFDPQADAFVRELGLSLFHGPTGVVLRFRGVVLENRASGEFRGVALSAVPPIVPELALTERLHLEFDGGLADGFGAFVAADGSVHPLLPEGSLLPSVRLFTPIPEAPPPGVVPPPPERFVLGGEPDDVTTISGNLPSLDLSVGPGGWSVGGGVEALDIAVDARAAGPLLRALLPGGGLHLVGSLAVTLSPAGVVVEGGAAPDAEQDAGAALVFRDTRVTVGRAGGALAATVTTTPTLKVGPASLAVAGIGARLAVSAPAGGTGNAGPIHLAREFVPPAGVGLALDSPLVRGGGFLARNPETGELEGALELWVRLGSLEVAVTGFAAMGTVEERPSVIGLLAAEFLPAVQLGLGFSLTGVGGILGVNRDLDLASLRAGLADGGVEHLLFPRDVVASAPEVFPLLHATFPPRRGRHVLGPMLQLGWGLPVPVARASIAVLVPVPQPAEIALLGRITVDLPTREHPLLHLDAQIVGSVDLAGGGVTIDAGLVDSFFGLYALSGDMALRTGPDGFVLAIGGVHPRYTPPRPLPSLRRVTVDLSRGDDLHLTMESYFAIAPGTVQFGAAAHLRAVLGSLGAEGDLGFDALIRTRPQFAFEVDVLGHLLVRYDGDPLCTADVAVRLEGPGRWRAAGTVSVRVLGLTLSGEFDRTWGQASLGPPPASVDVAAAVRDALAAEHAWTLELPSGPLGVRLSPSSATGLHPLGRLVVRQHVAPTGVPLDRFGPSAIAGQARVDVTARVTGAGPSVAAAPATERFVNADFFELTDDQRLTEPALVARQAGVEVRSDGWQTGASLPMGDAAARSWARRGLVPSAADGLLHVSVDAAGRQASERAVPVLGPGAVLGIDPGQIRRVAPADGAGEASSGDLALIEFARADLPWAFSPSAGSGRQPHPWLALVVVPVSSGEDPIEVLASGTRLLRTSGALLPDPAEADLWAHVHAEGESSWSRLLCPTRLAPGTAYVACVVPVFAAGRDAALQPESVDAGARADQPFAWSPADMAVALPAYTVTRFTTAAADPPSFAELVGRLDARPAPPGFGTRTVDVEGVATPVGTALRSPGVRPRDGENEARAAIRAAVTAAAASGRPAPRYGSALVDDPERRWLDEVNADPTGRIAAGLGASIVRANQDRFVGELWRRLAEREDAVTTFRRREFAAASGRAMVARWTGRAAGAPRTAVRVEAVRDLPLRRTAAVARLRVERALKARLDRALHAPKRPAPPAPPPAIGIDEPAYRHLLSLDPAWLVPGSGGAALAANSVTVLEVDAAFVAAVLLGMNEAVAEEARWRRLPLPRRTPVFRTFWQAGRPDLREPASLGDAGLADLVQAGATPLVVAVRGDVVRRFPSLTITAARTGGAPPGPKAPVRSPAFAARLGDDILIAGFEGLSAADIRASAAKPATAWWFFFAEQAGAPRFGFDQTGGAGDGTTWSTTSWASLDATAPPGATLRRATLSGSRPLAQGGTKVTWAESSAAQAAILRRAAAVHGVAGAELLVGKAP